VDAGKLIFDSTPYFNEVLSRMHYKIDHPDDNLKWIAYSAHDTNIVLYTTAFGLSNYECLYQTWKAGKQLENCLFQPKYTSNYLYELYEENGSN
jgi:hypothetical protein